MCFLSKGDATKCASLVSDPLRYATYRINDVNVPNIDAHRTTHTIQYSIQSEQRFGCCGLPYPRVCFCITACSHEKLRYIQLYARGQIEFLFAIDPFLICTCRHWHNNVLNRPLSHGRKVVYSPLASRRDRWTEWGMNHDALMSALNARGCGLCNGASTQNLLVINYY